MPVSSTTPGRPSACVTALGDIAFRYTDSVGTRNQFSIAAQWLACALPYRRFADILAAGLPAHLCENFNVRRARRNIFEKLRDMRTDNAADIRLYG